MSLQNSNFYSYTFQHFVIRNTWYRQNNITQKWNKQMRILHQLRKKKHRYFLKILNVVNAQRHNEF